MNRIIWLLGLEHCNEFGEKSYYYYYTQFLKYLEQNNFHKSGQKVIHIHTKLILSSKSKNEYFPRELNNSEIGLSDDILVQIWKDLWPCFAIFSCFDYLFLNSNTSQKS